MQSEQSGLDGNDTQFLLRLGKGAIYLHTFKDPFVLCLCLCVYAHVCVCVCSGHLTKCLQNGLLCEILFHDNFIRGSESASKKKREKAQLREQIKPNSEISQHKHGHLQMMNKRRDYERQSSSMPSSNGSRNPEVHLIFAAVCVLPAERWINLQTASFRMCLMLGLCSRGMYSYQTGGVTCRSPPERPGCV